MIKYSDKINKKAKTIVFVKEPDKKIDKNDKISKDNEIKLKVKISKQHPYRSFQRAIRRAVSKIKAHEVEEINFDPANLEDVFGIKRPELDFELVYQVEFASYVFDKYKSKKAFKIKKVNIDGIDKTSIKKAQTFAKFVNNSRDLANTPGDHMTPAILANEAKKLAKSNKALKCKVLGKKDLEKIGAGAILAVGRASIHEPRLIILEYKGDKSKKEFDYAFVGKAVTFDSGGLDIKPAGQFVDMYQDMTGGAAVLNSVALLAEMKIQKNVVAIVPAVENAVSGSALHPGDIIKSLSGKTIEVWHTDAEGRLILSDGIAYAGKFYKIKNVVTVATLTGAALVALGQEANAVFSEDEEFANSLKPFGEKTGDYVWPMPLWEEFEVRMEGVFADINNVGTKGNERYGGSATAAAFLWTFAKDAGLKLLHIDIAPRMTPGPNDNLPKTSGSLGGPVRFLYELAKIEQNEKNS